MKHLFVMFFVKLMCLIFSCSDTGTEAETMGRVSGYVYSSDSSRPMYYVFVAIRKIEDYSGETGYYELTGVEIGDQVLTAVADGGRYEQYRRTVNVKPGDNSFDIYLIKSP